MQLEISDFRNFARKKRYFKLLAVGSAARRTNVMANLASGNDTKGGVNWQSKFGQAWKQSDNRGFYMGEFAFSSCLLLTRRHNAGRVPIPSALAHANVLVRASSDEWIDRSEFKQRMEQRAGVARFDQP